MWIAEFVKNVITGHMSTPSANAMPGHRYARHARRRHPSGPTTASPSRHRPRARNPVANNQWTCSAGGVIRRLQVLEQSRHDEQVEHDADEQDEQRRLDDEPPEALPVRMEQRDAVRLRDRPDERDERGRRAERRHCARPPGVASRNLEFTDEFCAHDILPWSRSTDRAAGRCARGVTPRRAAGGIIMWGAP